MLAWQDRNRSRRPQSALNALNAAAALGRRLCEQHDAVKG
jgi:hypothetical protein